MENQIDDKLNISLCKKIIDNMRGGLAVYEVKDGNGDGKLKFYFDEFNKAAEIIDGKKKENLLGKEVRDIFPGAEKMGILKVFTEVYRSGKSQYAPKKVYIDPEGNKFYRDSYVFNLDKNHIATVYYDTTEEETEKEKINIFVESILPILHKVAMGDFRDRVKIPNVKNENKYTEIAVALNLMIDDLEDLQKENAKQSESLEKEVRKKTLKLKKSEEKLKSFFENTQEGIWCVEGEKIPIDQDPKTITDRIFEIGIITEANDAMAKMYGKNNATDIIGMKLRDITPPKDKRNYEYMLKFVKNNFKLQGELSYEPDISGNVKIIENSFVGIIKNGYLYRGWGVQKDVTEKIKNEKKIKNLAQIVENSEDAIIGKTIDGTINSWNHGAEKLYGYKKDEVLGKSINIIIPRQKDRDELKYILDEIKHGKMIQHYEAKRVTKDGKIIDVSLTISPVKNDLGKIVGASAIGRDITKRKEAERKYQQLFNNSKDALMTIKYPKLNYILANKSALNLFGVNSIEQFNTLTPTMLSPKIQPDGKSSVEKAEEIIKETLVKGSNYFEWMHKKYHGKNFPCKILLTKYKEGSGTYFQVTVRDITKEKEQEKKMKEQNENLEKMNDLMVGRELRMIELKKSLQKCKKGISIKEDFKNKVDWIHDFQKAIDQEESIINKLVNYYKLKIESIDISIQNKKEILDRINILIKESKEHEAKFRGLINYERE